MKKLCALILVFALIFGFFPYKENKFSVLAVKAVADNSTRDEATSVELNKFYEDSLNSQDDVNWYVFTTPSDGCVSFEFSREVFGDTNNYWELTLYHFDNNLKEISTSTFDGNHTVSYSADIGLPAGEYYLAMKKTRYYFSSNEYNLNVNFSSSEYWEKEINDTYKVATSLDYNVGYSGSLSSSSDIDWYTFNIAKEGRICVDFDREVFDDNNKYWVMTLCRLNDIDGNIEEITSWEFDGNHKSTSSPEVGLAVGKYYLKIEKTRYYFTSQTYTFTVNYIQSDFLEKELNDTYQTASDVALNKTYQGSIYGTTDVDWYHFKTSVNGYTVITFNRSVFDDTNNYWEMTLYSFDENLQDVTTWSYDGNHAKNSTPEIGLPPGDYYLKINKTRYYYSSNTYALNVSFKVSELWEREFNSTFQTATVINTNRAYHGSMYSSDDADWYEFNLNQDSPITIEFTTGLIGDTTNHWGLHLYQRTDSIDEIKSWNISGKSSLTTISDLQLDAGTYYIKVEPTRYYYDPTTYQIQINDGTAAENIMGDVNLDGSFNVADVVLLQKWLLAVPEITLEKWENADFCVDGKLDVFDLCLMKRAIISGD